MIIRLLRLASVIQPAHLTGLPTSICLVIVISCHAYRVLMAHGARGEYITGRLVKTRKSVGERFVIVNPSCRLL